MLAWIWSFYLSSSLLRPPPAPPPPLIIIIIIKTPFTHTPTSTHTPHTQHAQAKELRRVADRMVSWAKVCYVVHIYILLPSLYEPSLPHSHTHTNKNKNKKQDGSLHARRQAATVIRTKEHLKKLFDVLGPRYLARAGGYTRVLKLQRFRPGDAADMALIEFVARPGELREARRAVVDAGKSQGLKDMSKLKPKEASPQATSSA
jgi:ribosomal protein L17